MKIFYGAAIQGAVDRRRRAQIHKTFIDFIKNQGFEIVSDHVSGKTKEETAKLLKKSLGNFPVNKERSTFIRGNLIKAIEGRIDAAIFEVSSPSLGVGIEIAHAYLRPRMKLKQISILLLYEENYWPHNLSTMIRGITKLEAPGLRLKVYKNLQEAKKIISEFLKSLKI